MANCTYGSLAEIYHGRHAPGSNHRLGLAIDFNDSNYPGVVDGTPNPISRAIRQYNRNAMHKLDARQLPMLGLYGRQMGWAAASPRTGLTWATNTDWEHVDVGTK